MNQHLKKSLLGISLGLGLVYPALAQDTATTQQDPVLKIYRAAATRINNLVHTKLDVRFDYAQKYLNGKAWITLQPHFYPTDTLTLDAKGMDIREVAIVKAGKNSPLKYQYDQQQLRIQLDKSYPSTEKYTVYISYVAKPNELKVKGSAAINDAKGLYFINPDGKDPNKPIQIWTQGETESSSAWFPTIDKTNQKTTEEISMTVDKKYVTLSNGKLISQRNNADGTRTDTWKLDLPHAPYLFMMAVGDFAVIKDQWRGKEVNYYLEKAYAPYAKNIFGNTPEMLTFFSKILDYEYPWPKYSQVVVRDYVSGAMENTTATVHGDFLQKTDRELLDDNNRNETVIAHELFHHWFGDLATSESWSNLTVNESFADYSEYLWLEHKYGRDAADEHNLESALGYFTMVRYSGDHDLVRFHYHNREDMFDQITYQKGGRILHMLRNYVGDDAFFKSLNRYLKNNSFKATEAHQLRLAFEEVTGQDMNWFFNQWYFGQGYPELDITYQYNDATKKVSVVLKQLQQNKVWQLPVSIDIYAGGKKTRHQVMLTEKTDTFTLPAGARPDLVNVDADKVLLSKKTEHREFSTYAFQYAHAPLYMDRREAIEEALKQQSGNPAAITLLQAALKDKYHGLRTLAITGINFENSTVKDALLPTIVTLAQQDPSSLVKAAALNKLGDLKDPQYVSVFEAAVKDRSYGVAGAALNNLSGLDNKKAYALAKQLEAEAKGGLTGAIAAVYAKNGDVKDADYIANRFRKSSGQEKLTAAFDYLGMLAEMNNTPLVTTGVDEIKEMTASFKMAQVNTYMSNWLKDIARKKRMDAGTASGTAKEELIKQAVYMEKAAADIKAEAGNAKEEE